MKTLQYTFVALFFMLASLPGAQMLLNFAPSARLFGSAPRPPEIVFTAANYFSGEFQHNLEQWFASKVGFKAHLVRTDNELNYRAFRQLTQNSNAAMVLGKDGYLFERAYIDAFNRRDVVPPSYMEEKIVRLKKLQDYMAKRGAVVLLVISPSKPLLYPELLPAKYIDADRQNIPSNYEQFVPLLEKHGVNYIDSQKYLTERKPAAPFRFFQNSAAHWNDPASCDITSQIAKFIQSKLKVPMLELTCEPYRMREAPRDTDRDLLRLGNFWSESSLFRETPYPESKVTHDGTFERPQALFVGSSFVWSLLRFLNKHHITRRNVFYYYYNSLYSFPGKKDAKFNREDVNWERDVFTKQAIVLEINAAVVQSVGFGFLEDADREIDRALAKEATQG